MHNIDLDLNIKELTKVEGAAGLDLKVRKGKVTEVKFKITEYKRFFTNAMKGKPIVAMPQHLARICGTCSNAHLICSIQACENALDITPSPQTKILRELTYHGLIIRDHALHLYLFSMPDIFGKDAFLDFDENDEQQHQMLHDGFEVKSAGNFLATLIAGRSVHAPFPVIGGFLKFPEKEKIVEAIEKLEKARPAVLRLTEVFEKAPFHFDRKTNFMALIAEGARYGYLEGVISDSFGNLVPPSEYRKHLEHVVLPYSQASAYKHKEKSYMVGALARLNLTKEQLNDRTKKDLTKTLKKFPSTDIYHNNLAQAVEILHSIDDSIDLLKSGDFKPEPVIKKQPREAVGIGVIEAPRGTLYHKVVLGGDGIVKSGEIVVPTGQNQINIEEDVYQVVEQTLKETDSKEKIEHEIEKLIRAYDPCMSCGSHFLKVKWK